MVGKLTLNEKIKLINKFKETIQGDKLTKENLINLITYLDNNFLLNRNLTIDFINEIGK